MNSQCGTRFDSKRRCGRRLRGCAINAGQPKRRDLTELPELHPALRTTGMGAKQRCLPSSRLNAFG
jgi:hypothetical protein